MDWRVRDCHRRSLDTDDIAHQEDIQPLAIHAIVDLPEKPKTERAWSETLALPSRAPEKGVVISRFPRFGQEVDAPQGRAVE